MGASGIGAAGADVSPKGGNPLDVRRRAWAGSVFSLPNVLTALYLVVGGMLVSRHGLWRDEAQAFLIARDSASIRELFYNLRFEGHPPLWHFLLWVLTRVTQRPEAMQWLHLAMAGTTVWLVARFAPFPKVAKVLFPFGYFPLFEYGVLARNYQLILLMSVVFCAVWVRHRTGYVRLGVIIALLCLSHALGVIVAAGLGLMLVIDALTVRGKNRWRGMFSWGFVVGFLIAAVGAAAAVQVAVPKEGGTYAEGWHWDFRPEHVQETMRAVSDAYVPVSPWGEKFWNRSVIEDDRLAAKVGRACAVGALLCVIVSWRAALVLLVSDIGLLLFFQVKFLGYWRHHGVLFVALVAALWIAWSARPVVVKEWRWWWKGVWWVPRGLFMGLLGLHVYAAAVAVYACWKYPFSPGREAAAVIRREMKPGDIVVSGNQVITTSVAAYLPGVKMYFPVGGRWGTFTLWDDTAWGDANAMQILAFAWKQKTGVIVVRCWDGGRILGAKELGRFEEGIADNEMYSVQRIGPLKEPLGSGRRR
ncbi:MAG TPA: hypothetical protein VM008_19495 [Phycisphaerae bacterium]|nr:hypothetical protein [Phycisphaerae bacterium]